MVNGILYNPDLQKLISSVKKGDQNVLFEMEDGSLKNVSEITDFHKVRNPLKPELIRDRILNELFGEQAGKGKSLDKKHVEHFMALLLVVLENSTEATIKKAGEPFEITIKRGSGNGGKILSELLRE